MAKAPIEKASPSIRSKAPVPRVAAAVMSAVSTGTAFGAPTGAAAFIEGAMVAAVKKEIAAGTPLDSPKLLKAQIDARNRAKKEWDKAVEEVHQRHLASLK